MKGNYNDIILYNEQLYVSTSDGVYYLTEIKDYSEKEITVKVKQKPKPQTTPKPKPVVEKKEESIDESKLSKKEKRRLKWI